MPENFIPRAIFNLVSPKTIQDILSTAELKNLAGDFRFAWRNWVSVSNERTLISTIIPPSVLHVNTTFSMKFPNYQDLLLFGGLSFSIVYDFFIRVTGVDHLWNENILNLPFPKTVDEQLKKEIINRTLKLVCITKYYKTLWQELQINNSLWNKDNMSLSHKDRRNSLVELDVLSAMALGITLEDLVLLYTTQFPTLLSNENETFYDKNGRIIFTINK